MKNTYVEGKNKREKIKLLYNSKYVMRSTRNLESKSKFCFLCQTTTSTTTTRTTTATTQIKMFVEWIKKYGWMLDC